MNAEVALNFHVIQFVAILARVGGFFIGTPGLGSSMIPRRIKGVMALALTVVLLPTIPSDWVVAPPDGTITLPFVVMLIAGEMLTGILVGFVLRAVLEMFAAGGEFTALSMGLMRARVVNPGTQTQSTIVAVMYMQMMLVLFIVLGGVYTVVELARESFQVLPPGSWVLHEQMKQYLIEHVGNIFYVGVRIALPVIFMIMLVNISLGLCTRFGQEFNVLMLSFPIRFGLGFVMMGLCIPILVKIGDQQLTEAFSMIERYILGAGG